MWMQSTLLLQIKKKKNFLLKGIGEIQLAKKKTIVYGGSIFKFFFIKDSFKREDVP
jgi:hypothetical protein